MNTRQELLGHLREMLEMEGFAGRAYTEIAEQVQSPKMRDFFRKMADEEKGHAEIVKEMIGLLEGI